MIDIIQISGSRKICMTVWKHSIQRKSKNKFKLYTEIQWDFQLIFHVMFICEEFKILAISQIS